MRTVNLLNEELLPEVSCLLQDGHIVTLKVKGNSMMPFITGGRDCVVLKKKDNYTVGDIALAEISPMKFVLHRIIKIEEDKVTIMGDGNLAGEEICYVADIRGIVDSIIRKGKHIDCNSRKELYKTYLWRKLFPFRRYFLAIYKRIGSEKK